MDAFLSSGLPLHHIDSHHHVHGWKALKSVIIELATMYQVPIRYTESLRNESDLLLTEQIWTHFYDSGVNNNLFSHLKDLPDKHVEVMTHPGFVDDDLRQQSSYTLKREEELELLCSLQLPNWAEKL
ncbi:ChbG/HpnK family deacetylase [Virgibacillus dokdonensis]|uniref:ChbG/HpnK family deacetylase n=1 Tax=Virgibacillus dokdonensis TaxID=302167 RepID=UPI002162AE76|nr:ChbG/HpnK family deacetylase [Virgibacillus dokdonensis]